MLSDVSRCKAQMKLSTNGKSCPSISPGMSRICSDLFKTYLLCPRFLTFIHLYLLGWFGYKTNHPNRSAWLHCHELRKKIITSLNPEGRAWTLAGRKTAHSMCVVLVFWSDGLFMWCFSYKACSLFPTSLRWSCAAWHQYNLLCLVVERSFPSTYCSLLSWVAKNGVLI